MRYITAWIILLMIATTPLAQTSTPTLTPIPGALEEGLYRFIDLVSPSISLSGTWVIDGNTLRTLTNGATVTIPVRGRWVIVSTVNYSGETYEICFTACTTYSVANTAYPGIAVAIPDGQATMVIRKVSGARLMLDRIWIMQGVVVPFDPAAFGTPAPAPSPYVIFVPVAVTAMQTATPTPTPTNTPTNTPTPTETPILSPTPTATITPTAPPTSTALYRRWVESMAYTADGTPQPIRAEERFLITSGDQQISGLLIVLIVLMGVSLVVQLWRR